MRIFVALILLSCIGTNHVFAQLPSIEWQKNLGGSDWDCAFSLAKTGDGGYIVAGTSQSADGDITGPLAGYMDIWVVKMSSTGDIEWQQTYGGADWDNASAIKQTSDGGYVIAGTSESHSGYVSGNHGSYDYWVFKITSTGVMEWQRCLGGTDADFAFSIQQTNDAGFIVAGYTNSISGDISVTHGNQDGWLVKLDNGGNLQWEKSLGGTGNDQILFVEQTPDGGYIAAGSTNSNDGDVSLNKGGQDCWIVKLDNTGFIEWQKTYGGLNDEYVTAIHAVPNGYVFVASANSSDQDITNAHGYSDIWVVKLDLSGSLVWEKSLGGSFNEYASGIELASDGGYLVAGYSNSGDGDITGNHAPGRSDFWLVKLNASGVIEWQNAAGGTGEDQLFAFQSTVDGGYIVAGWTDSDNSGDVSTNKGSGDFWIVKLHSAVLPIYFFDFSAALENNDVALTWTASSDGQLEKFSVQRSIDGRHFEPIGEVPAVSSGSPYRYHFKDYAVQQFASGYLYYRLSLLGEAGHENFSKTFKVKFNAPTLSAQLLGNPATETLGLKYNVSSAGSVTLQIHNMAGVLLAQYKKTVQPGINILYIPISSLPNGAYALSCISDNGDSCESFQFMKK